MLAVCVAVALAAAAIMLVCRVLDIASRDDPHGEDAP
jgi:hypothetical protein